MAFRCLQGTSSRVLAVWAILLPMVAVAQPVEWVVDVDGDWETAANWSSDPALPGSGDDAVINRPGFDPLVTLNTNQTVLSLVSQSDLHIASGSLTLLNGGDLFGDLSTGINRELTVRGDAFTVHGSASIDSTDLHAQNGGSIALPTLTSYAGSTTATHTEIRAFGAGSAIDLSSITSLAGNTFSSTLLRLHAAAGGSLDISSLTSTLGGKISFAAEGTDSAIDLSSLTEFIHTAGNLNHRLAAVDGGTILASNLTDLYRVELTLDDTGTLATSQMTHFNEGKATISAAAPDFSGIVDANGSSFIAHNGATITLANVASYAGSTRATHSELAADGDGSLLDMSSVTTMHGNTFSSAALHVNAEDGGVVDLSALETITGGRVRFTTVDDDSRIDLTSLTSFTSTGNIISHIVTNGGTINLNPSATATLTDVHVFLSPTGQLTADTIELVSSGSTTVRSSMLLGVGQLDASLRNASGDVRPNDIDAGEISITGSFEQQADGTLFLDVLGLGPDEHDRLTIAGDAMLDGELFVILDPGVSLAPDLSFLVLEVAGSVSGTFNGLAEGATVASDGEHDLFITYTAGDGQSVALYTVPEPGTAALLTLLAPVLWRRRQR